MNDYVKKPGTTNLWTNKYKKTETAPGWTAIDLNLPDVEGAFQASLWGPKRAKNGETYYTLQVKKVVPKEHWKAPSRTEDPPPKTNSYTHSSGYVGGDDDDTPF